MNSWHSYPSIYAMGHRAVLDLLTVPVNVEEKVDGSQFSFGVAEDGEIKVRSKGVEMNPDAPEKMFSLAVQTVKGIAPLLIPGWTYRGEYLSKPKHNSLAYNRVPKGNVVIFDINTGDECYLPYENKAAEAERIGLEAVPLIYSGMVADMNQFKGFLDRTSFLGGPKVEGAVVKPRDYNMFATDKKVLMGKFVSEAFKEIHSKEWRKSNPTSSDVVGQIGLALRTEARWLKAVQHLRDSGQLTGTPKDIGQLLKDVAQDVHKECAEEVRDRLFKWAWPHIQRKVVTGLAEWYKGELLKQQFATPEEESVNA